MIVGSSEKKLLFSEKAFASFSNVYAIQNKSIRTKSSKTKCSILTKRNVIFSCKTKCNKIKTHTAQKRSI